MEIDKHSNYNESSIQVQSIFQQAYCLSVNTESV